MQQGGTLATVDNQQEQDALSALIPTSISSLPLTGGVWIGLSDILREGTFDTWRDDSPVIFSGWKFNQPNNGASGAQHCVQARFVHIELCRQYGDDDGHHEGDGNSRIEREFMSIALIVMIMMYIPGFGGTM